MLVCWWWWFDWSFARLVAPVVQLSPLTTSIILCFKRKRGDNCDAYSNVFTVAVLVMQAGDTCRPTRLIPTLFTAWRVSHSTWQQRGRGRVLLQGHWVVILVVVINIIINICCDHICDIRMYGTPCTVAICFSNIIHFLIVWLGFIHLHKLWVFLELWSSFGWMSNFGQITHASPYCRFSRL